MGQKKQRRSKRVPTRNRFFREIKSMRFNESILPLEFSLFVESEIWPQLKLLHRGYRLKEKKEMTAQCLHNLIETGLTDKVVADSRDDHKREVRKRITIWDVLVKKKLCRVCKGTERSKRVTLYRASGRLLDLREKWELKLLEDLDLMRNTELAEPTSHALVVLYSGKADWLTGQTLPNEQQHKPLSIRKHIEATCQRDENDIRKPSPQAIQNGLNYFRDIERLINSINEENLSKHSWLAYVLNPDTGNQIALQPNVCLRQIHSGRLFRGTRLYSWGGLSGQGMSKKQRRTIQIDGESAAEIDSHCHSIRLAYHMCHMDKRGDVYWPEKVFPRYYSFENASSKYLRVLRNFVKKSTNIALNVSSQTRAIRAISGMLRDNKKCTFLTNTIFKTENTNLNGILERIVKAHPKKVANDFFTGSGINLMETDSKIMLLTLMEFVVKRQKPALAIHDSLVIRASDVMEAKEVYTETYYKCIGFKPVLKHVF